MKKEKIIFWITTSLIFLTQGVGEFLMLVSGKGVEPIAGLGYPPYFAIWLIVFKILGVIVLMIPFFPKKIKELAYAGFLFDFIFAFISIFSVDGLTGELILPLIALGVLSVSYRYYNKLNS